MKPEKSLRSRALDILSRREVSHLELKRKLMPYAQSEEELEAVLNEFAERRWQSDERYAEAYVHSKRSRYGSLRIKQALAAKGVDEETVRELMPDKAGELSVAADLLRKKFKQPGVDLKEKQKQMRFLVYRGFDMDTIQAAMKNAWDENGEISDWKED